MIKAILFCLGMLCGIVSLATESVAQDAVVKPTSKVIVATRVLPPFIVKSESGYAGFSAELWEELARRTGIGFDWLETESVKAILAAVNVNEAQVGIAAISSHFGTGTAI